LPAGWLAGKGKALAVRDELDIPIPAMAPSYRQSVRRREEMDPATKRLAIFASVIGTALLGLVAAWAFTGHHRGGVPVIEAASGPVKVKPANPGGLQVPGANDEILSGGGDGKETVAPGPEAPAPQALQAQEQAAAQAAAPPAPTAPAQPDATAQAAPPEPHPLPALRPATGHAPAGSTATDGTASVRLIPGARPPGPLASAEAARRAARVPVPLAPSASRQAQGRTPETLGRPPNATVFSTAVAAGTAGAAKPAFRVAQADTPEVTAPPAAPVTSAPLAAPTTQTAPAAPAAVAPSAAPAAPEAAAPPAGAHGHRALVQLSAVGSGEAALKEWGRLSKKYPDLFAGHTPNITKTEHDGKVFWRVRTGGFADSAQAAVFCQRAKAKGLACTVAAL
jgi:hypothetical protein